MHANEESVELALHRKHPEDHQNAVWDPPRKVAGGGCREPDLYTVLGGLPAGAAGGHLAWRESAGSTATTAQPAAERAQQKAGSAVPYEAHARSDLRYARL